MRSDVQHLLGFIRAALYRGQKSNAKARAQDAFEQLVTILEAEPQGAPACGYEDGPYICALPAGHGGDCRDRGGMGMLGGPGATKDAPQKPEGETTHVLYDADPDCKHEIEALWSGVKCKHCPAWFCY